MGYNRKDLKKNMEERMSSDKCSELAMEELGNLKKGNLDSRVYDLMGIVARYNLDLDLLDRIIGADKISTQLIDKINTCTIERRDMTSVGNYIKGITDWSRNWYYQNWDGSVCDLTEEKLESIIDTILFRVTNNK